MSVDAGHGGAAAAAAEPVRALSVGQHAPAPASAPAHDVKADASSGGGAIHAAAERVHVAVDNSAAINANCTAAYLGRADALREAKEGLFEVGVVLLEGAPHALFHVPDGSKASADASGKPYRLLPLHAIVEQPAPPKAEVNPDDSYYDEPRGGESPKRLPQHFAFWRAPVFYAAAAGRKDAIAALIERHRDCAADRARIYTVKASANQPGKWEVQENASEHATTPKPKFVDAAAVARANGFDDAALALDKSYRACSTEDCSLM